MSPDDTGTTSRIGCASTTGSFPYSRSIWYPFSATRGGGLPTTSADFTDEHAPPNTSATTATTTPSLVLTWESHVLACDFHVKSVLLGR